MDLPIFSKPSLSERERGKTFLINYIINYFKTNKVAAVYFKYIIFVILSFK